MCVEAVDSGVEVLDAAGQQAYRVLAAAVGVVVAPGRKRAALSIRVA
jgi:hypothetical protein